MILVISSWHRKIYYVLKFWDWTKWTKLIRFGKVDEVNQGAEVEKVHEVWLR